MEGDDLRRNAQRKHRDFYPRPPGGGRLRPRPSGGRCNPISIHALRVEGDEKLHEILSEDKYFYPRPPGGGRLDGSLTLDAKTQISIHALRVEGDSIACFLGLFLLGISIHALRVEGDSPLFGLSFPNPEFLSTPSGWRATQVVVGIAIDLLAVFLSTPSGWRATRFCWLSQQIIQISIHALRVEGDLSNSPRACPRNISIHALRVEGDI